MGWSLGYSERHKRDIGYGVPAYCDMPGCKAEIDRGLGYKCEDEVCGCEKFYCENHRHRTSLHTHAMPESGEHPDWLRWKLTHESWQRWRDENPALVVVMRRQLAVDNLGRVSQPAGDVARGRA